MRNLFPAEALTLVLESVNPHYSTAHTHSPSLQSTSSWAWTFTRVVHLYCTSESDVQYKWMEWVKHLQLDTTPYSSTPVRREKGKRKPNWDSLRFYKQVYWINDHFLFSCIIHMFFYDCVSWSLSWLYISSCFLVFEECVCCVWIKRSLLL